MFTPGRRYNRREELHKVYGGQRQGGISTPTAHPLILIFTGEQGELYGYEDGFRADGAFWYTGEGQHGDMEMIRGNRALRDHQSDGRSVHLFTYEGQASGFVEYVGEATYVGHHRESASDREGASRQAIVFEFAIDARGDGVPAGSVQQNSQERDGLGSKTLEELRRLALESGDNEHQTAEQRNRKVYLRSQAVRRYVLKRAGGICEGCGVDAPFSKPSGEPYLEPHHIRRRADAGPDHPRWVVALCPNCHRRVHHGADGKQYNATLAEAVGQIEVP